MAWSSRERVTAALQHREPDRTPMFEYVLLSPVADQLLGRTYGGDPAHWPALVAELGWSGAVKRAATDRVELAARLGHDLIYAWPNPPRPQPAAPGRTAPPPEDPVERLVQRNEQRRQHLAGPSDETLAIYPALRQAMADCGVDLPVLAPAYAHGVWTDVDLLATIALAPDVAAEHFRLATAQAVLSVDRYLALGIELLGVGGDFAGQRLLLSPEAYRRLIVPEVRAVSRRIHAGAAWAVNASDGDLWPVIDDFLVACEVDAYLEIDMHAGMDLRRLKEAYGDRTTFLGNLDCGNTLSFGTVEQVKQQVTDCLAAGWGAGGHILCASNAITASVPLANYRAVMEAYWEYFGERTESNRR